MSFQAYIDNIKEKTGKTPDDFRSLATEKGLLEGEIKAGPIVQWLKTDFGLGHGHAMAVYAALKGMKGDDSPTAEDKLSEHFSGKKAAWQTPYNQLVKALQKLGKDVTAAPNNTYINILRGDKKFAIIQISGERMDIGIKLKNEPTTERFEAAGKWNAMMTHRAQIKDAAAIDNELLLWLQNAYTAASGKK